MRSDTGRARWLVLAASVLAILTALPALAQVPLGPEAAVAMYRVWNPATAVPAPPAPLNVAGWAYDPGIPSTNAPYYADLDRGGPSTDNLHTYRWGDQIQIVVELSLPIWEDVGDTDYLFDIARTSYVANDEDLFVDYGWTLGLPLPANSSIDWVRSDRVTRNGLLTGVPGYIGDDSWDAVLDPDSNRITGITWAPGPVQTLLDDGSVHVIAGDLEPGGPQLPEPATGDLYELGLAYTIHITIAPSGDVIYPNPRTGGAAPGGSMLAPASVVGTAPTPPVPIGSVAGDCRLNQDNLVVDWIESALNADLTTDLGEEMINPNLLPANTYDPDGSGPMVPRNITSASIELVGPDLDPAEPGSQSPTWTITNGRLASARRPWEMTGVVGEQDLASAWRDFDNVPCLRWDERTTGGTTPPDTQPDGTSGWKRIVRLVFGGTGYPGTRGALGQNDTGAPPPSTAPEPRETRFQVIDDPDAFVIGPQPGLRFGSTEAWRYDGGTGGWSVMGLQLGDRTFSPDPFVYVDPASAVVPDNVGGKLDNPFVPGLWKVANITLTVSPDPDTPDIATSSQTLVIPMYPKAPWAVPDPLNAGIVPTDPVSWTPLPSTELPSNCFVVEHPLDVQIARADEENPVIPDPAASTIGAGRFGFVGNPGSHAALRPDGTTNPGALAGDAEHRYYLAQGNHDFPTLVQSGSAPTDPWDVRYWFSPGTTAWRWLADDWDGDGSLGTTDAPLPGWDVPVLDLGAGSPGQSIGWARTGADRGDDGLWLSNMSHTNLYRAVTRALQQTVANETTNPTPAGSFQVDPTNLQHNGPGAVRIDVPPLRPIVATTTDNWTDPNPDVEYVTAGARDWTGRPLPNGSYPAIPGRNLRMSVRGRDLATSELPVLSWARSNADRTSPVSTQSPWSAYDDSTTMTEDIGGRTAVAPRQIPDTFAPERVVVSLQIPNRQPALASSDGGDWTDPNATLEVIPAANDVPITYYGTQDPDDTTVPDGSGPGVGRTDTQAGNPTLGYQTGAGAPRDGEDSMVRVYVDVNGNGKLDLPRVDLADAAYNASLRDPFWRRFLYAEPYRCVAVRAKVLPSYDLAPSRQVVDMGLYGHADPRSDPAGPWSGLPAWDNLADHQRDLGVTSRGNFPLGVFGAANGTPGLAEIGLTATSALGWPAWLTDEAEQGVCVPIERLMPNYLLEGLPAGTPNWNPDTTGWSFLPAPPDAPSDSARPFVDGTTGARDGALDPGEDVGSFATADILGAGTPLGTYWLQAQTYMERDGVAGYAAGGDQPYGSPIACKATVKESALPPVAPGPSREAGKDSVAGGVFENANTSFGELGPAFLTNTWDMAGNVPNVTGGDYGQTAVFFASNRPDPGAPAVNPEGLPWRLWAQEFDWDFAPGSATPYDEYRPIQPTFRPTAPAFVVADAPTAAQGVTPPQARFSSLDNFRTYPPSVSTLRMGPLVLGVVTWSLEADWSDPATGEISKSYYIGGAAVNTAAGSMGQPLVGPIYFRSEAGARFGPRPVLLPATAPRTGTDVYIFYYTGSGPQRRLGYMVWNLSPAPAFTYLGSHELPIMTRYGTGTIRLDGLEYAKDPYVFPDVWYDAAAAGGPTWHDPDTQPTIGVVFAGKSTTFRTQDIFYTRFDPAYPTSGPLSDPANFDPTTNNTGQVAFPEQTTELEPLRQEALAAGRPPSARRFGSYASPDWVDWIYDPGTPPNLAAPAVGISVRVLDPAGAVVATWGPGNWIEDPVSGLLYQVNAQDARELEVDPTVGLVRFVDETRLPGVRDTVEARFTPQTRRLTRSAQDTGQPVVVVLPEESIEVPLQPSALDPTTTVVVPPMRTAIELPLRMVLLYKRHDTEGRTRLLYETFSMPYWYLTNAAHAVPAGPEQIYWTKVTNPDPAALGLPGAPYPQIDYPTITSNAPSFDTQAIPFYVDRGATQTALDETVGELCVAARPVRYSWFTDQTNLTSGGATRPDAPPFVALGGTTSVTGPSGSQTLQQVVGPTTVWFMFSSTAEKLTELVGPGTASEDWTNNIWGIYGSGEQAAYGYDADWDQYFAVLSPQGIPRTVMQLYAE